MPILPTVWAFCPPHDAYDAVVSLAVLHHVATDPNRLPAPLAHDIAVVTKPGAMVILQDVPSGATLPPAQGRPDGGYGAATTMTIFAELVDPHSMPTHDGVYLKMPAVSEQLSGGSTPEFDPVACFHHACDWHFPNREIAARYVRSLFNLGLSQDKVAEVLEHALETSGSNVFLPWALDCLVLRRTSA